MDKTKPGALLIYRMYLFSKSLIYRQNKQGVLLKRHRYMFRKNFIFRHTRQNKFLLKGTYKGNGYVRSTKHDLVSRQYICKKSFKNTYHLFWKYELQNLINNV
jgi:hypothetical protein